jgi:hypothetical protein
MKKNNLNLKERDASSFFQPYPDRKVLGGQKPPLQFIS